jgi:hypothetical protein
MNTYDAIICFYERLAASVVGSFQSRIPLPKFTGAFIELYGGIFFEVTCCKIGFTRF